MSEFNNKILRILILDNYDSFTFNLFHYCKQFCEDVVVLRNDEVKLEELSSFDKFVLSPGPGLPQDAGIMNELISRFHKERPILGVCLGMQAIAEFYGGVLSNLPQVLHGVQSECIVKSGGAQLFKGIHSPFKIGHYHSWVVEPSSLPTELEISSINEHGHIMAIQHRTDPVCGVQFHPESILTEHGLKIIENWIREAR